VPFASQISAVDETRGQLPVAARVAVNGCWQPTLLGGEGVVKTRLLMEQVAGGVVGVVVGVVVGGVTVGGVTVGGAGGHRPATTTGKRSIVPVTPPGSTTWVLTW
jgi:hypothetical protein